MTTHEAIVYVYLPDSPDPVPAGLLRVIDDARTRSATFAYGRRYLERENAIPLDPIELPLEDKSYETKADFSIFSAFNDQLPDAWGRHVIARLRGLADLSEFDYLTLQNKDTRIGALGYGSDLTSGPGTFLEPEFARDIHTYLGAMTEADLAPIISNLHLIEKDELPPTLRPFLLRDSSVGGARPKMTCLYHGVPAIAKFQRDDDTFNMTKLEYVLMSIAQDLGMNVPPIHLQRIGTKSVYIIERFDRNPLRPNCWGRRHFISGLTAVTGHESDRDLWGYQDLVNFMKKFSYDFQSDRLELFHRMIYNILVANTDDHLKNHAFLYDADHRLWRLSPLYDVVSSLSDRSTEKRGFLLIGKEGRTFSKRNLLTAAAIFGLSDQEVAHTFESYKQVIRQKLPATMIRADYSAAEQTILIQYLEQHWLSLEAI